MGLARWRILSNELERLLYSAWAEVRSSRTISLVRVVRPLCTVWMRAFNLEVFKAKAVAVLLGAILPQADELAVVEAPEIELVELVQDDG